MDFYTKQQVNAFQKRVFVVFISRKKTIFRSEYLYKNRGHIFDIKCHLCISIAFHNPNPNTQPAQLYIAFVDRYTAKKSFIIGKNKSISAFH